jgi:murein DD-endopeptidase MepM/ murein hydrolase activator NlpD
MDSAAQAMRLPVAASVSSGFGMRSHPILGSHRFHKGVDLRAAFGTPIRASADGRVAAAGWNGGYGREVRLDHGQGLQTLYAHMSRLAALPGQRVHAGEIIGFVGSSGLSTGPHLHYEVLKDGRPVNPLTSRMVGPTGLDRDQRRAFNASLRTLLSFKPGQG